jgi:chorismate mutase
LDSYEEKILNSFNDEIRNKELDDDILNKLLSNIVCKVIHYEQVGDTDLNQIAKQVTNSLISETENL